MSVKMCKLCPMYLYLYICILCKVLFYVFVCFICRTLFLKTEICKESSFSLSALTTRLYDTKTGHAVFSKRRVKLKKKKKKKKKKKITTSFRATCIYMYL